MNIPSIIKQQLLRADLWVVWSWGAHQWTALSENTLAFRVQAHRLHGIVSITLDKSKDLYTVSFFENKSFKSVINDPLKKFETIEDIYCDQLLSVIDEVIEKLDCYKF